MEKTGTEIKGEIERITFASEDDGFTVAKVKLIPEEISITVIGKLFSPVPGEILSLKGEWVSHPQYGKQFKASECRREYPVTTAGIRKYLRSGFIKGIGPVMADRIVQKFGDKSLDIIENHRSMLTEIEGIGKKRLAMISGSWDKQQELRELILFLQSYGIPAGYASKIYKKYRERAVSVISENPYRLAREIFGIGFLTADQLARNFGIPPDSQERVKAGILHIFKESAEEGHLFLPIGELINKTESLLEVNRVKIENTIYSLEAEGMLVIDRRDGFEDAVYLKKFYRYECEIARKLAEILKAPGSIRTIDPEKTIQWVQEKLSIRLAIRQMEALRCALNQKVMVITGGPGTGKTTVINSILQILSSSRFKILLAAPTGRASKRMKETTGWEAKTIHRLLEYSAKENTFRRNEENPLDCDLLVLDEVSMIDVPLLFELLRAVPPSASIVFVGDADQLPSVGPGNILHDLITSGVIPVVRLNEIFRQSVESLIISNAHRINHGLMPLLGQSQKTQTGELSNKIREDFFFITQEESDKVAEIIKRLVCERIPHRFGFDPFMDIQVLTPMRKGSAGTENLNAVLQDTLNTSKEEFFFGGKRFKRGDKIMQIKNNYVKEVFNGDIGKIIHINEEMQEVTVEYDTGRIKYKFNEMDEVVPAYAVTVHKSQGCEYPAVVMPVLTEHYLLLKRNLLYTAVTRAKKLVVLVGTKKALAIAVKNNKTQGRYTRLRNRLKEQFQF
ncbi:MAG: ATP-dependent RecD-like DNA helicase [Spirochaetes bacterium]|nr:MAG: ATP-dependent RecD-like DNA helicase [Spirochaetota bacterium]